MSLSQQHGGSSKLWLATLLAVSGGLGMVVYRLEQSRPLDLLERAGAKVGLREDGSAKSLVLSGPLVSDECLRRAAALPRLTHLTLEDGQCAASGLAALQSLERLVQLTLRRVECPPGALRELPPLPSLETFWIEDCRSISDEDIGSLTRQVGLTTVHLSGTAVTDAALEHLVKLPRLEVLILPMNPGLTEDAISKLCRFPELKLVDVRGIAMTSEQLLDLAAAFPAAEVRMSSTLLTDMQPLLSRGVDVYRLGPRSPIDYGWFKEGDVDAGVLHLLASKAPGLRFLNFRDTNVSDEHLAAIAEFRHLEMLNIGRTRGTVTAEGLKHLEPLSLRSLSIFSDGINDRALEVLGRMTTLRSLQLSGPMTDDGVPRLSGLTNLVELSLSGSHVTGSRLETLEPLADLRNIYFTRSPLDDEGLLKTATLAVQDVGLSETAVTPEGIRRLQELRPDLRIREW